MGALFITNERIGKGRKVDVDIRLLGSLEIRLSEGGRQTVSKLPGKGKAKTHGTRLVRYIISVMTWIR